VLELQREIAASPVEPVPSAVKDAAAEAVSASAVAAAVAVTPDVTPAAELDVAPEPARESTPTTRPIKIDAPIVQLDGLELDDLTVAERLGLASDDDEVGPTS
jgi:cell division transport system ATP-binding protein